MKSFSFKINYDQLLLCVLLLNLLWGTTDSSTTLKPSILPTVSVTMGKTITTNTSVSTVPPPPPNVNKFNVIGQTETSITLQWTKVTDYLNYILKYGDKEKNVTASVENNQVTHTVSDLNNGTSYTFTLFTVLENVRSSGVNLTAVTAPPNVEKFELTGQTETSITLQWTKVTDYLNYILKYGDKEKNVTASVENNQVTHTVSDLNNGTSYTFTLFTVLENVRSSGVNLTAVTVPQNAKEFKSIRQTETSITLQWTKVGDLLSYSLRLSDREINVTASEENYQVTHTVSDLNNGTRYTFTLFTVLENVRSSGVNLTAVTEPANAVEFKSAGQNDTSITLQWMKVDDILNYTLAFNDRKMDVTASVENQVTHTITDLKSGTRYIFTLFTKFETVSSSGVNLTAFTAPENVKAVTVLKQNESSITLMWDKVKNISEYILQYGGNVSPVITRNSASHQQASVTHEVSSLTAGTKYDFTLITVFEGINSTGFRFEAVTVPPKVAFVNVSERTVTSITLTWNNGDKSWSYLLQINGSNAGSIEGVSSVVSHLVLNLKPGTAYEFSVITVFSGLNSTAYKVFTVTAIDCTSVAWQVTNSSIKGVVEGLFSNATASNATQTHVSLGGREVSFTGLYPGATYAVSLVYERYQQCHHNLTIIPPVLSAHCEYWASGYSVYIVWNKPEGVWTAVEVNVTGNTYIQKNGQQHLTIAGFQPAKTYKVSLASWSGTVRSSEPFVFKCSTDPRGVIAGSVLTVLLVCALIFVAVFVLYIRPDLFRKKKFIGGSKQSTTKTTAISVEVFADHFYKLSRDDNRGFSLEYESLAPVGTEQTRKAALLPDNKVKNRFTNVLPYDWSRVKLTMSNPNDTCDYINANYMPGYNNNREYIASQGPLPSTVNDFWRMIWEQRVTGIVMVTNCTEGGRTKCERYWPTDNSVNLNGELIVTLRSEQQESKWTLREFSVKHRKTSEQRTVKHFHFTAWPDHGVPQGTEELIKFRGLVRQHIERGATQSPTVVHCSAGVGRTGTIIALDVLLQQLQKKGAVDINGFVHKMRLNRPHMVQTESQYVFLHQCVLDSLQPIEKTQDHIYENADMIYVNATALQEFHNSNS